MSRKFRREFYIPVTVGDVVVIKYLREKITGLVTRGEMRYGLECQGALAQNPLLTLRDLATDLEIFCDNSYVEAVVSRYSGHRRPWKNYFRENYQDRKYDIILT